MTSASAAFSASSAVTRLNSVSCTARAMIVTMREKAGMAAALAQLLDDPARREAMGAAARDFALNERTPERAAAILDRGLAIACKNRRARLALAPSAQAP